MEMVDTRVSFTKSTIPHINMRSFSNKYEEPKQHNHGIITVQMTKLTTFNTKNIPNYTLIHNDRVGNLGGGLITYITFTDLSSMQTTSKDAKVNKLLETQYLHNASSTPILFNKKS